MIRATAAFALSLMLAASAAAQSVPMLTLDDAIALALEQSGTVQSARLAAERARGDVATARTRRLPAFNTETQVSRLLRSVNVTFPAGAFGVFPPIGPVPAEETTVTTPAQTSVLFSASVSQPITGLLHASVGERQSETTRDLADEDARAARLSVVHQVRHTYYAILQAMSALEAADTNARLLTELGRVVANRVAQRVALKADGIEVETRLAQNELTRVTLRHAIASNKEQLNHLLGRDLSTDFEVMSVSEIGPLPLDVPTPEITSRPDIRRAELRVQQADLAIRRARLDRLPEVNVTVQTISPVNIDGAPGNITSAGVQVKWEPFDWGRRSRAIAANRLEAKRAGHALRDAEAAAQLDINRRRRAVEQAHATLRVALLTQQTAREHARVRTTQYQAQAALLSDVLQAQATLAESTNEYQQALLSLLTARADLDHALGEERIP